LIGKAIKVLHVVGSIDPAKGGISEGIRNLTAYIYDFGFHCEVICIDDPNADFLTIEHVPVHAVGPSKGPWQYSPGLKKWLFANLQRFDVVIINGLWIHACYLTWRLLKKKKKNGGSNSVDRPKLFVMPHGMLDPYFQRASNRKIKAIRNWLYFHLFEKKMLNNADGVFFTSESERVLANRTFRAYSPRKEVNIGYGIFSPPAFNGAMTAAFYEACPEVVDREYLIFLGRINSKKGVDMLVQSYLTIAGKWPLNGAQLPLLVIAGPGLETEFGKHMLTLAKSKPELSNLIVFPGMLSGDAKWGAFYNCSAFILPSHQENFGIAVAEAMACGKPVLVSDQVNIMNEIKENAAGLIAPDTVEGTTRMIEQWLSMPAQQQIAVGKNAELVFAKHFDIKLSASRFIEAISH